MRGGSRGIAIMFLRCELVQLNKGMNESFIEYIFIHTRTFGLWRFNFIKFFQRHQHKRADTTQLKKYHTDVSMVVVHPAMYLHHMLL